jgi:predicted glycogen debranching enzyme
MIIFGRDICGDLANAERREWLVTSGIGGFASGTIAGTLTRRYHGLLLAALQPPNDRTLLASKFDEMVHYGGQEYALYTNRWVDSTEPNGFWNIERFCLEGTTPVWLYALAEALLEKRIWMQPGANTTYVSYSLARAAGPLKMTASALVNYRHYHSESHADRWQMHVEPVNHGLKAIAYEGAIPIYLLSDREQVTRHHDWYFRFFLIREADRGLTALDDNLYVGQFEVTLQPGDSFTFVTGVDATPNLDGETAYQERREYERGLQQRAMIDVSDKSGRPAACPGSRPVRCETAAARQPQWPFNHRRLSLVW